METSVTYANLVSSLVSKLANMQNAGVIKDFNFSLYGSTWEDSTLGMNASIIVYLGKYSKRLDTYTLQLRFDETEHPFDSEELMEFDEKLDSLVKERYEEVEGASMRCKKIESSFKDIIGKETI